MSQDLAVQRTVPSPEQILALIPHRAPFRFIDEILKIDEEHIVARYRFREDETFYEGHFPGNPITPGVILAEAMAQSGVVALGIYNFIVQRGSDSMDGRTTVFTDFKVELLKVVRPGDRVTVTARRKYFRRDKIRSLVDMTLDDGTLVCSGDVAGVGVKL